jgi:anti-anti-sigma factor
MVAVAAALASRWTSLAERAAGKAIFVDCSTVRLLSSETLNKLISLQGRLRQRQCKLVLTGLRAEVRDVLRWTRIDRFLEIE